tara:strand:- start:210 stop:398 length:189 start_codon:yes stop_codon:yes gene_type:complete
MKWNKKIALIKGAGDYLGSDLFKKFAIEALSVVVIKRRGDLTKLVICIVSLVGMANPFSNRC